MKDPSDSKTSADYQRAFRERMRQQGLVKKDLWIRQEYAAELAAIEKRMREEPLADGPGAASAAATDGGWSAQRLFRALSETSLVRNGLIVLEWMEGAEPSLHLVMRQYGDLPLFLAIGQERIVVEALMWPVEQVRDPAAFNELALRTGKLLPLSTIGIEEIDSVPCYTLSGSLDAHSSLANVVYEIETLADNAINAVQVYAPLLKVAVADLEETGA